MTKSVLVLVVTVAAGFSSAALAAPTAGSITNAKAPAAVTESEMIVAQQDNNGVRDWGKGYGRDDAGQGKGQGKKGQ
jgi:hypothetical protein